MSARHYGATGPADPDAGRAPVEMIPRDVADFLISEAVIAERLSIAEMANAEAGRLNGGGAGVDMANLADAIYARKPSGNDIILALVGRGGGKSSGYTAGVLAMREACAKVADVYAAKPGRDPQEPTPAHRATDPGAT